MRVPPSLLFVLVLGTSTLAINPFGGSRAEVWITPKVVGHSMALVVALAMLLTALRLERRSNASVLHAIRLPLLARAGLVAWVGALVVSTIGAPDPAVSLVGYAVLAEGSLFYGLTTLLAFVVFAMASAEPRLRKLLVSTAIVVGSTATLLAVPQKYEWHQDFTVASARAEYGDGRQWTPAGVWREQTPNSVFWHRGHFGFVAVLGAAASVIALADSKRRSWFVLAAVLALCLTGALISDTRTVQAAAILAIAASLMWLWREAASRHYVLQFRLTVLAAAIVAVGLALLVASTASTVRPSSLTTAVVSGAPVSELSSFSGRTTLWQVSVRAWLGRPWFGNGFLTFNQALGRWQVDLAESAGAVSTEARAVVATETMVVVREGLTTVWSEGLLATKPHNALLELLAGVGVVGLAGLVCTLASAFWCAFRQDRAGAPMLWLLVGGAYLFFWYESVQYSPLYWAVMAGLLAPRTNESNQA